MIYVEMFGYSREESQEIMRKIFDCILVNLPSLFSEFTVIISRAEPITAVNHGVSITYHKQKSFRVIAPSSEQYLPLAQIIPRMLRGIDSVPVTFFYSDQVYFPACEICHAPV